MVQTVVRDIASTGHMNVILKRDKAPAMKALASRVQDMGAHPTIAEELPEYAHQTNGIAERIVQTIRGLFATPRSALEHHIGERSQILMCLILHVANL